MRMLTSVDICVIDNRDVPASTSNNREGFVPRPNPGTFGFTRRALRALIALNLLIGFLILALLIATLLAETPVFGALGVPPTGENAALLMGMRLVMVVGVVMVPLSHIVLTRLLALVDTVGRSDPFVVENAMRLRMMAWAVLALELLHLVVGVIVSSVSSREQPLDVDWSFSFAWIAVLLLFVLARVFEQGALMRDELQGTV